MHLPVYLKRMAKEKNLKANLKTYKEAMLGIDPEIKTEFENNFPVN